MLPCEAFWDFTFFLKVYFLGDHTFDLKTTSLIKIEKLHGLNIREGFPI
jgi:hypothetical protein